MSKKPIKIPGEHLKEFYEKQKLSIRKIAKIYGCGTTTIQRRLHKYSICARPSMSEKLNIPRIHLRALYEKENQTSSQLARRYSCSPTTILNRLKEYNIKIKDIVETHIKYPKNDFSGNLIEKAYFIGFRLGDLHVKKYEKNGKTISVECASTRPAQIILIRNLFKRYGYVRVNSSKKNNIIRIQCALNSPFYFLLNKEDRIEPWVLNNDKLFFAFFAGYLDAEGDIGVYSKGIASLRVGTYDKNILSQIQSKLINKGVIARLNLETPKGRKINLPKGQMSHKEYKTRGDFWRLAVYRKKDLLTLFNRIAPYLKHYRMKKGLLGARRNIVWRNQEFGNLRMN